MTPGRRLATVVALDALGAVLLLASAGRTWFAATTRQVRPLPDLTDTFSGADLAAVRAVGLVALAGVLALVAAPPLLRRLVGVGLVAVGVLGAVDLVGVLTAPVVAAARAHGGGLVTADDGGPGDLAGWAWVALIGTVLVSAAGVLAVVWTGRLAGLSSRYTRSRAAAAAPVPVADRPRPRDPDVALWDAIDTGHDPTRGPGEVD